MKARVHSLRRGTRGPLRAAGAIALGLALATCQIDELVSPDPPGTLVVEPTALRDSAAVGSRPLRTQTLSITSSGAGSLGWTATPARTSSWLALSVASGSTPATLTVSLDPAGLFVGDYQDTVIIAPADGATEPVRVPVRFAVQACRVIPYAVGATVTDSLTEADCEAPHRAGRFARLYRFSGTAGDSVSVTLRSTAFSAYVLLDSATAGSIPAVAESDRCAAESNAACLRYVLLPRSGEYWVEVTSGTGSALTGAFTLQAVPPRPPASPASPAQFRGDSVTPIAVGASIGEPDLVVRVGTGDPDPTDSVAVQVEIQPVGVPFGDTASASGALVPQGTPAYVRVTGLADNTAFRWRARLIDQTGRTSAWVAFGGNADDAADVRVAVSQRPEVPTAIGQFRSDGTTAIAAGAATNERTVVFRGSVTDPDPGDQVRLEVEVQPFGTAFTGVATAAGVLVPNGTVAAVTVTGLADGAPYHWQVRTVDQATQTSDWVAFAAAGQTTEDFRVVLPATDLAFATQPSATVAGSVIAPAVTVEVRKASGIVDTTYGGTVSVVLAPGTGTDGATLGGTLSVAATRGVAMFANLTVDRTGTGYRLLANATGLNPATSDPFDVTASTATRLVIATAPGTPARSGIPLPTQPAVQLQDASGNPVGQAGVQVIATIASGPTGASLAGDTAVSDATGRAAFTGLSISGPTGSYTLRFDAVGLTGVLSGTVGLLPGDADAARTTASVPDGIAGTPTDILVTVRDGAGNQLASGGETVTVSVSGANSAVPAVTDSLDGTYGASYTPTAAGTDSVAITLNGAPIAGSPYQSNVTAAGGARLVFLASPAAAVAGANFAPPVQVAIQDANGNTVTSSTAAVTVAIGANPGGGTLVGTLTVNAVSGVATFGNLSIDKVGTGYTLTASASGLAGATSPAFDVTPGAAAQLAFTSQPSSAVAGSTILPPVVVTVQDANGNTVTASTASVTVGIGTNAGGGTLSGTLTVSAVGGVATFSDLSIDRAGAGYTLAATSGGLTDALSSPFTIEVGSGNQLAFIVQPPTSAVAGAALTPAVQVAVQDANGNTVTSSTAAITLAIGVNAGGGTLGGTATVAAVNGIATFTNLTIDRTGTGYTLTATGSGLVGAESGGFNVTPAAAVQLAVTGQPSSVVAGAAISPAVTVAIRDAFGNTVTGSTAAVTVALAANPGGGTLAGTTTVNAVGGVATFSTLSIDKAGIGYTLAVTSGGLTGATSNGFTVTPGAAAQLGFLVQPAGIAAGTTIAPAVQVAVQDANGNTVTTSTASISLAIGINPGGGTLTGTTTVAAASGVATFAGLTIDKAGAGYTLTAASAPLAGATSAAFTVSPGAAARLAFVVGPSNTVAGQVIAPPVQVAVQDTNGNTVTSSTAQITVAIGTNPAGGTLSGTATRAAVNGVATFGDLSINAAGAGYTLTAAATGLGGAASAGFDIEVGSGNRLAFTVQPSAAVVGAPIAPSIEVTIQDAAGNRVTTATDAVTLALANNPGGATLSGTLTVNAVAGIATFANVRLNRAAAGYTLTALGSGLLNATSGAFDVTRASTTTSITSDLPDPSVTGQQVTVAYSVAVTAPGSGTPTGSVTVSDGAGASCTATVAAGSCGLTFTTAGSRTLTAAYAGSADFTASTSAGVAHTVNTATTTTVITSDLPDPSVTGQPVTVNYTVTAGGGTPPEGTVTVSDGTDSCSGTPAAGTCTLVPSTTGIKTLTATFGATANYTGSSDTEAHTVNRAATTTAITSDLPDPSVTGEPVTVSVSVAPVAPGAGVPTGSVTVTSSLGLTCVATLTNGTGGCALTFATAGARTLTATYAGDANFAGSTSTAASHQVNPAPTTTTITGDTPDPSTVGQAYAVSFTVTSAGGTPTGTVTVSDGTGASCAATVALGSCQLTSTSVGTKTLTASYAGDANFAASVSAGASHVVGPAATTTTVSSSANPSVIGQGVTFTAAVTSAGGTPTGNVRFRVDGSTIGTPTALSGGVATSIAVANLAVGPHVVTAEYLGATNFAQSVDTLDGGQVVNRGATTTAVTSSLTTPTVVGQPYTVSVAVAAAAPAVGTPTGTVTVSDGSGATCGPVTLVSGAGSCSLTSTTAGAKTVTASYAGDASFLASASPGTAHTVNRAATATTITSDTPDPTVVGQPYTVAVTVAAVAPGVGTPTGSVTVSDGTGATCSASLTAGAGSCALVSTTAGAKTVTASYVQTADFAASTSAGVAHQVNPAATTTALDSLRPTPSAAGQTVAAYYRVLPVAPGAGTVTGNVTVSDGAGTSCVGTVAAGSCTLSFTAAGARTVSATYAGTASFLTSASGGVAHTVTAAVADTLRALSSLTPAGTVGTAASPAPTVIVVDRFGNPVGGVAVTFTPGAGSGSVSSGSVVTGANGQASVTWTLGPTAGPQTLTVASGSLAGSPLTFTATATAAGATQLGFAVAPPASVTAGATITPAIQVAVRDASGNTVTSSTAAVTLAFGTNPGGGTLAGTTTVNAVNGVAVFSNLSIDRAGTGYTLTATAAGLTNATSAGFTVTPGAASRVAYVVQPANTTAGAAVAPPVQVAVQDANGNTVTASTAAVTLAIENNPAAGTLSGTLTANAVNGVATFADLSVDRAGTGYTLRASSTGLTAAVSQPFDILVGAGTRLGFLVQPGTIAAGAPFTPPVQVAVQDANGNTVTGSTAAVTLAIGTNPGGGTLSGTATVNAVNGVATFAGLTIDRTGTGYTLTAAAGGLTGATSTPFDVTPGTAARVAFTVQPGNTVAGLDITPPVQVAVQDTNGNTVTSSTAQITLAIGANPSGGTLSGTATRAAVNGVATFGDLSINAAGTGYTLTAAASGLTGATSAAFDIQVGTGNRLGFVRQPSDAVVGAAITPSIQVAVQDAEGNTDPSSTAAVTLAISNNPGGASLSGTTTVNAVNGIAEFTDVRLNRVGTGYTLAALGSGLVSATSTAFTITAAATTTTITSDLPDPSVTGQPVTVAWSVAVTAPGGGTPTGSVTVSDGTGATCVSPVAAGACALTPLTAGAKTLTATYAGDANFTGSTSAGVAHTVSQAATTTVINSDLPDPSVTGQPVTVSYTVNVNAPGGGTPTGTVTVAAGTDTCTGTPAAGSCQLTLTSVGAKSITATYGGDANYLASPASAPAAHQVTQAATTTQITSDLPDPSVTGEAVTVSVAVAPVSPGTGVPTGSVTVTGGTGCTATLAGGVGSCAVTFATAGPKTLTASYAGDANFTGSTSTAADHQVDPAATVTTITADTPDPTAVGEFYAVSFTVTSAGGTPTGNVTVSDGTGATCVGALAAGAGNCTMPSLTAGAKTLTAAYAGDGNFAAGTTAAGTAHTVNPAATATAVSSSANPSVFGQSVTFTATVTSAGGTPVGTVQFLVDAAPLGTPVALAGGTAASIPTTALAVGTRTITAQYTPSGGNFSGSTGTLTGGQAVNRAATEITIASDTPDPSTVGQAVTVAWLVSVTAPGAGTPTGNVTVSDGAGTSCTAPVASGNCSLTFPTFGTKTLTATYEGDANFAGDASGPDSHEVTAASTATAVASSVNPSVSGQPVTFTATVTSAGGTPTGAVQFVVDGASFGTPVTLVSGVATSAAAAALAVGTHTVGATYVPADGNFSASSGSLTGGQVVNPASTTTAILSHTPDPSTVTQAVTVAFSVAPVAPGAGTPTGNVTVSDGAGTSCTATVAAGSCSLTFTTAGAKTLTAAYAGDASFSTSASAGVAHTVEPAQTTTTIASSANPSTFGQDVTFTATVASAVGTPTGNVRFQVNGADLGTPTSLVNGVATSQPATGLAVGTYTVTARYLGATNFAQSVDTLDGGQVVTPAPTTTAVVSSLNPSTFGQSVTFTATVTSGAGTPDGTVQFQADGANLGTAVTLAGGQAQTSTSTLAVGDRVITAAYSGAASFAASGATLTPVQTVNQAPTTTTITSALPDPSIVGEAVTVQVTVASAAGTPTGGVTVGDGAGTTCAITLAAGAGSCQLAFPSPGARTITADYAGDGTFAASSGTESHEVNPAPTATAVSSSLNPSPFGQSVTFTATVTSALGTPAGAVQFQADGANLGSPVVLDAGGQAQLASSSLAVGTRTITAAYGGGGNFAASLGTLAGGQVVQPAATTTTVASAQPDPSLVGQTMTVQVTVTSAGGTPSGTVTVSDGAGTTCQATLSGGAGSCGLSWATAGARSLTAAYAGDGSFAASTSATEPHTVNPAPTTTTITGDAPDPSAAGEAVTVGYTVTVNAPGAGTPTGSVTVSDGAGTSCSGTVAGGSCALTFTAAGPRTLTATYAGDGNFLTSTSAGAGHDVTAGAPDTLRAVSSLTPAGTVGQVAAPAPAVIVVDAYGNPVSGETVSFTPGAGSGTVSSGSVVTDAGGLASVTWTLGTTAGAQTLAAASGTLVGSPVTFTATAAAGPASAATTSVTASPATGVTADGVAASTITVTVQDAFGNPVPGATVTLAATGSGNTLTQPVGQTGANGQVTGTLASTVAETKTVTATVNGTVAVVDDATVTFVAGAPAAVAVSAGDGQTATVGTAVAVAPAARVTDAFGNVVGGVAVTFAVASGEGTVTPTTPVLTNASGIAAATSWTLGTTAGPNTLTATVTGLTPATFTATGAPGAATGFTVSGIPDPIAAGTGTSATVTARDAFGNVAIGYLGTVHVTSSDPQAVLPPDFTFTAGDAGVRAFAVTLRTAGEQSVTVTQQGSGAPTGTQAGITVQPAAAASLQLTGIGDPVTAGAASTATVTARDAFGNVATGYTGTIAFTSSDAGATLPASYAFQAADNGVRTFTGGVTLVTAGEQSVTVTDQANGALTSTQAAITVQPAAAATVAVSAGDGQTATVGTAVAVAPAALVTDAFENPVSGVGVTFAVASGGGTVDPPTPVLTNASGVAAATTWTLGAAAGTNTLTATVGGLTPATFTATATAGTATSLEVTGFPDPVTAGSVGSITVTARDALGNVAAGYTGTVTVTSTDVTAVLPAAYGFTTGDAGVHTFTGIELRTVGEQTLTASDGTRSGSQTAITVQPAAAASFVLTGISDPITAGTSSSLTVTARDPFGNVATGYTGTVSLTSSDPAAVLPPNEAFTVGDAGVHVFAGIQLRTAGEQNVTATQQGSASPTGTLTGITVQPAAAATLQVTGIADPVTAGVASDVTVTARDAFGNVATGYTGTVGFTSNDPGATLPANYAFQAADNGVHAFGGGVTLVTAGERSVTATDEANAGITGAQAAITVQPAAAAAGQTTATVPSGTAGSPTDIVITVRDAFGNKVTGAAAQLAGSVTGANTATLAAAAEQTADTTYATSYTPTVAGTDQVTITLGGADITGSPFTIEVSAGTAASVTVLDGDNQIGLLSRTVNIPPAVLVTDAQGNPVPGETVTFGVTGGGGAAAGTAGVTDAAGIARVGSWTLGGTAGANALQASITAGDVTFAATGQAAAYDVEVRYFGASTPTASQQAAFDAAAARWEQLVFGDVADIVGFTVGADWCGVTGTPALTAETIDDLVIYAEVTPIDGPGGILGSAGPCFIRTTGGLPLLGVMRFDSADLDVLEADGQLEVVITHEMGHVIGLGTLWNNAPFALLADPCPATGTCTTDPHFIGARGLAAFDAVGGTAYTASAKVPVEATGGPGTHNGHWRETVFDNELMTGYLNGATSPLSILSVASFWDMGYLVSYADADAFAWSPSPPALRVGGVDMGNDILRAPIGVVGPTGRVERFFEPTQ